MASLEGLVAAVTGAARGVGLATVEGLVAEGVRVALGDPDLDLAREAAERLGEQVVPLPLDVTDPASFAAFLEAAEERLGPLDVLVNNAGLLVVGGFLEEDDEATDAMIDINLRGVIRGCRLVLPGMLARDRGHVVNIASMAGRAPLPLAATYSATKHAVMGLTDALREELRGTRVRMSTIMPTVVETRAGAGVGRTIAPLLEPEDVAEVIVHVLKTGKPEATVPRWVAALSRPAALLPPRARSWLVRLTARERAGRQAELRVPTAEGWRGGDA